MSDRQPAHLDAAHEPGCGRKLGVLALIEFQPLIAPPILKMGKYIAIIMPPTTTPKKP